MITNQIESLITEYIPLSIQLTQYSGAGRIQAIRESSQLRQSYNVTVQTIIEINRRMKQMLLNSKHQVIDVFSPDICTTSSMLLNQYPGLCFTLNTFIQQNNFSLLDLLDIDITTLLSENISLEAFGLILRALGILPNQVFSILIARYVMTYGGFHIFVSNNVILKLATSHLQMKPKPSAEFLCVVDSLITRQIYRGFSQVYCLECAQVLPCSIQQEVIDFGIVTQSSPLTISTSFYPYVDIQSDISFPLHDMVRIDLMSPRLQQYQAHISPFGQIIQSMEIMSNIRKPCTFDALENKIIEMLIGVCVEVDGNLRTLLVIGRQTGEFVKMLRNIGDDRVIVQITKVPQQFSDERQGLPHANIFLPIMLQGCAVTNTVYQLSQIQDLKINNITFQNIQDVMRMLPENVKVQTVDQADFYKSQAKLVFKLSNSAVSSPNKDPKSVIESVAEQHDPNCYVLLSQTAQNSWVAQNLSVQLDFTDFPLMLKVTISESKRFNIEIVQSPDSAEDLILDKLFDYKDDQLIIFSNILEAFRQRKLKVEIPLDFFIDAYISHLQQGQEDVQVPTFQPNQEFEIEISKATLFHPNNYILVPQQMKITSVSDFVASLPVFAQNFDQLFDPSLKSAAMDGLQIENCTFSNQNSNANSLSLVHGSQPKNSFDFKPFQFQPDPQQSLFAFDHQSQILPGNHFSQPATDLNSLFMTNLPSQSLNLMDITQPRIYETMPSKLQEASQNSQKYVQLSANSIQLGSQIASLQDHCDIDTDNFMLTDITGYVRYHFPSYNVAIVAFCDPFHKQGSWNHSLAVWYLPDEFKNLKLRRDPKTKNVSLSKGDGESIFIARALVKCNIKPMEANSGIYIVEQATLIDYQDPCEKFKMHYAQKTDTTIEGSVYWQEIQKKGQASYGFVRLASGHERHFYLKQNQNVLGHLVKLLLFNDDPVNHPNSCQLIQSILPPPDRHRWLFGRIIGIYQEPTTELLLKQSFRTQMPQKNNDACIVNGMILTEPMQGTHVDLCFFRVVVPKLLFEQLKVGLSVYFTLKELALHKVVDQTDSVYQTPVELVNMVSDLSTLNQAPDTNKSQIQNILQKMQQTFFTQNDADIGNSRKLSCWAVDNICLQTDTFQGHFKSIPQRKCSGLQTEQMFFEKYGKVLLNGSESLVYVPRPTLNIFPPIFKELERFFFHIHFVFAEQKNGFVPEANQIKKIEQDVSSRRIQGRVHLIGQRSPLYLFQPNNDNIKKLSDTQKIIECLQDSLTPETNCYVIKPSAFYWLTNEILNRIQQKNQPIAALRQIFDKLIKGELGVYTKKVSIALVSDGEFERNAELKQVLTQQQNYYTNVDDQGNKKMLFWCRQVEELCFRGDLEVGEVEEVRSNTEVDFLTY
ncbi:Conserved_hypothetical protein [Hexamita inflata]|uniref:CST complex subunit CTC1 n=1 Tax=Hexamita inflata TaxID=28002 RepID=A0ABP1HH87_9EUKA